MPSMLSMLRTIRKQIGRPTLIRTHEGALLVSRKYDYHYHPPHPSGTYQFSREFTFYGKTLQTAVERAFEHLPLARRYYPCRDPGCTR